MKQKENFNLTFLSPRKQIVPNFDCLEKARCQFYQSISGVADSKSGIMALVNSDCSKSDRCKGVRCVSYIFNER